MLSYNVLDHIINAERTMTNVSQAPPPWTAEDEAFLATHLGYLPEAEIASRLNRTVNAVHLRWFRDLHLPAPSKVPGTVTANQFAAMLGIDGHAAIKLADRGLIPARRLPGKRSMRVLRLVTIYRWVINPEHWPYFRPWAKTIPDPHLRRLVSLKMSRWNDEWWTPGQVARYHGLTTAGVVNRRILKGTLPAIRWGNWWIKRSDATQEIFFVGKGKAMLPIWSPRADAFILRARAAGESWASIARQMKYSRSRVAYRWNYLQNNKQETI